MSLAAEAALVRPMSAADLGAGQRLSASFRWPHRLEDWALMLELGEGVVAELDGAVAGTAMAWRYGDAAATVGMIIVAEALQGRGMGRRLLQSLLDRLPGRTVRLNATSEGLKLYRGLGFVPTGGTVTQYEAGRLPAVAPPDGDCRMLDRGDLPWMAALDRRAAGMGRESLLAALLAQGGGVALDRDAFALGRRFGRGHLIGPVVAPDTAAARRLIGQLLSSLVGQHVRIDIAERPELAAWLLEQGFRPGGAVLGMARGPLWQSETVSFAVASQAYG